MLNFEAILPFAWSRTTVKYIEHSSLELRCETFCVKGDFEADIILHYMPCRIMQR